MQTFLPYPDFVESAKALDYKRLGKQRVEAKQILDTLSGVSAGWKNHPAAKMWRGYEDALSAYYNSILNEWLSRGYKNTMPHMVVPAVVSFPSWLGSESFHRAHQSNLVRKNPEFYSGKFPGVPADLPYIWPA